MGLILWVLLAMKISPQQKFLRLCYAFLPRAQIQVCLFITGCQLQSNAILFDNQNIMQINLIVSMVPE